MDGNSYQPYLNPTDIPTAPALANNLNETMPPLAPPYRHLHPEENSYPISYSEEQTFNRLMDDVHQGRIENIRIGQNGFDVRIEDARIVHDGIEVRALLRFQPDVLVEHNNYLHYPKPAPVLPIAGYVPPIDYRYQNQPLYQPYQNLYSAPPSLPPSYPPQYLYQPLNQPSYTVQLESPYLTPMLIPQYQAPIIHRYSYPNRFSSSYFYQFPATNAIGGVANAISQLLFTSSLLRR